MKLYGFPASPNTWKVRALAAHLGVPLEHEFVDLTKGASHTPAYLAINPTGRTPALVDGDFKLWESVAIMQYIASQKPNSLWPDNARLLSAFWLFARNDLRLAGLDDAASCKVPSKPPGEAAAAIDCCASLSQLGDVAEAALIVAIAMGAHRISVPILDFAP